MRIRTIKPSFWSSSKLATVSHLARLLFIGLFNEADDDGRLNGSAFRLAGALFQYDVEDAASFPIGVQQVAGCLAELEAVGLIKRYSAPSKEKAKTEQLIWLPGWYEHQRINKPTPSRLPPHPEDPGRPPGKSAKTPGGPPEPPGGFDDFQGLEEEEEEEGEQGGGRGSGSGEGKGGGAESALPPEVLPPEHPEGSKALADARAMVIRDNRNERNAKKAGAEAIYGRPQSVDALLAFVGTDDTTVAAYLATRFVLFDGRDGRPRLDEVVTALWPAFQGQSWGISGRDAIRWLVKRMSEDHQKLRQSEMIIAEKKAKGVSLPAEQQAPAAANEDVALYNQCYANSPPGSVPSLARWRAAGRPAVWIAPAGSGGAPQLPPSSTAANHAPAQLPAPDDMTAEQVKARDIALSALSNLAAGKVATPKPRLKLVQPAAAEKLSKAELKAMREHSPESRMLADEYERIHGGGEGEGEMLPEGLRS